MGFGGVVFVQEVDKKLLEDANIRSGRWEEMVKRDKALNFGLCEGQKAALVREESITHSNQMRVFTRLSVTAEKKPQVYALVGPFQQSEPCRIASLPERMIWYLFAL